MKNTTYILLFVFIISSLKGFSQENNGEEIILIPIKPTEFNWKCKVDTVHSLKKIDSLTNEIDYMYLNNKLTKYIYPMMSYCGGGLNGFYLKEELIYIKSTYGAELGFSSRYVYWNNGKVLRIIYKEHFAEFEKYEKNYPIDKFEFDSSKMTYSDTVYTISFGVKIKFEKKSNEIICSENMDENLIERLVECAVNMKSELENEKVIK